MFLTPAHSTLVPPEKTRDKRLEGLFNNANDALRQESWQTCQKRLENLLSFSRSRLENQQLVHLLLQWVERAPPVVISNAAKEKLLRLAIKELASEAVHLQQTTLLRKALVKLLAPLSLQAFNLDQMKEIIRLLLQIEQVDETEVVNHSLIELTLGRYETLLLNHYVQPILLQHVRKTLSQGTEALPLLGQLLKAVTLLDNRLRADGLWEQAEHLYTQIAADRRELSNKNCAAATQFDERPLIEALAKVGSQQPHPPSIALTPSDSLCYRKLLSDVRRNARWQLEKKVAAAEIQKTLTDGFQRLIQTILTDLQRALGPAPCDFALIGLGSYSREEMLPHSDLEFALLVKKVSGVMDAKEPAFTEAYFSVLLQLFMLQCEGLGENLEEATDQIGFHLDTGTNPIRDPRLYGEPKKVALGLFQTDQFSLSERTARLLAFSLLKAPRLLAGQGDSGALLNHFIDAVQGELLKIEPTKEPFSLPCHQHRARQLLADNLADFQQRWQTTPPPEALLKSELDIKGQFTQYLTHFAGILGLYYNLPHTQTSAILTALQAQHILAPSFGQLYQRLLSELTQLRLFQQLIPEPEKQSLPHFSTADQRLLLCTEHALLQPLVRSLECLIRGEKWLPDHDPWQNTLMPLWQPQMMPIDVAQLPLFSMSKPADEGGQEQRRTAAVLALHHRLLYDLVLPSAFHHQLYDHWSQSADQESWRAYYIDTLQAVGVQSALITALSNKPNAANYRQSERLAY